MEKNENRKKHKYLERFDSDIVLMDRQYQDSLETFDAGSWKDNFNDFIRQEWESYANEKNGVTYLILHKKTEERPTIAAYCTLSSGAIPYIDRWYIPPEEREKEEEIYDEKECGIPAIEIKMFAVSKKYQDVFYKYGGHDKPVSAWILAQIIEFICQLTEYTLSAKAIFLQSVPEAEAFYRKNGFDYVLPNMHTFHTIDADLAAMYLPLTELKIHYDT